MEDGVQTGLHVTDVFDSTLTSTNIPGSCWCSFCKIGSRLLNLPKSKFKNWTRFSQSDDSCIRIRYLASTGEIMSKTLQRLRSENRCSVTGLVKTPHAIPCLWRIGDLGPLVDVLNYGSRLHCLVFCVPGTLRRPNYAHMISAQWTLDGNVSRTTAPSGENVHIICGPCTR